MARFKFEDYYDLGTKGYPTAGTWEASLNPEFTDIIASVYKDAKSRSVWVTPLEYVENGVTKAHSDLENIYVRCKLWIDDDVSDWFYLDPTNQNDQTVVYTENKEIIKTVNSLEAGFN